jgi:hypothetical protein
MMRITTRLHVEVVEPGHGSCRMGRSIFIGASRRSRCYCEARARPSPHDIREHTSSPALQRELRSWSCGWPPVPTAAASLHPASRRQSGAKAWLGARQPRTSSAEAARARSVCRICSRARPFAGHVRVPAARRPTRRRALDGVSAKVSSEFERQNDRKLRLGCNDSGEERWT